MSDDGQVKDLAVLDNLPRGLQEIKEYAYVFAKSGMFPDIKSLSQGMVKIIAGRELGLTPFASMRGFNIINGNPEMSANLIASLIKSSGRYDYQVSEWTNDGCELTFYEIEKGSGKADKSAKTEVGKATFNKDDATKAGLISKANWQRHPRSMYFARALSMGARTYCPDIFQGAVYVEGEISDSKAEPAKKVEQIAENVEPEVKVEEPVLEAAAEVGLIDPPAPAEDVKDVEPIDDIQLDNPDETAPKVEEPFKADDQFMADVVKKMEEFGLNEFQKIRLLVKATSKTTMPDNDTDWMKLDAYLDMMASDAKLKKDIMETARSAKGD